jgi:hypothetical protein
MIYFRPAFAWKRELTMIPNLYRTEYLALLISLFLLFLEVPVRIITLLLRMQAAFHVVL